MKSHKSIISPLVLMISAVGFYGCSSGSGIDIVEPPRNDFEITGTYLDGDNNPISDAYAKAIVNNQVINTADNPTDENGQFILYFEEASGRGSVRFDKINTATVLAPQSFNAGANMGVVRGNLRPEPLEERVIYEINQGQYVEVDLTDYVKNDVSALPQFHNDYMTFELLSNEGFNMESDIHLARRVNNSPGEYSALIKVDEEGQIPTYFTFVVKVN